VNPFLFRDFYGALLTYEGSAVIADLIDPWLDVHADQCKAWFAQHSVAANEERFGRRSQGDTGRSRQGDLLLRSLYAFSRVLDLLLLGSQRELGQSDEVVKQNSWLGRDDPPPWTVTEGTGELIHRFATTLGLSTSEAKTFDPFFHEIARVIPVPDVDRPIKVAQTVWPLIRAGDLIVARQGVVVEASSRFAKPGVADRSTLFWS